MNGRIEPEVERALVEMLPEVVDVGDRQRMDLVAVPGRAVRDLEHAQRDRERGRRQVSVLLEG